MPRADGPPAELLPWDSEFFGRSIGRVVEEPFTEEAAARVDRWADENDVDCLYLVVPADNDAGIRAAEDNGFRLVEIRVAMRRPRGPFPWDRLGQDPREVSIRPSRPEDLADLRRVAAGTYADSRFSVDPNFPREKVGEFYATWIEECTKGYQGESVLVSEVAGRVNGFITFAEEPNKVGRISLIAVDAELMTSALGSRISHQLVLEAQRRVDRDKLEMRCATQGRNVRAQRFIQRYGYHTEALLIYFHKWYERSPAA